MRQKLNNLLIPMCGKSSRFPNTRPKWMLTHPMSGDLMCVESIKGIRNINYFDKIYFVLLSEHESKYKITNGLKESFKNIAVNHDKLEIIYLDNDTQSQSETVYHAICKNKIEGFLLIKDSDGYFESDIEFGCNSIYYSDINSIGNINAGSKSYLKMDKNENVSNIVEKKVISGNFCVGGYGFKSTDDFCKYYDTISGINGECYISNVIFEMLLNCESFKGVETQGFLDWGTIDEWRKYCKTFCTFFVDIDGTLITNTSEYVFPYTGDGSPLQKNIDCLNNIYEKGRCRIILTTSRNDRLKDITISELYKYGIKYDDIIMNLPHGQRILVNDFSNTNTFPTAVSINLERDSDCLERYI